MARTAMNVSILKAARGTAPGPYPTCPSVRCFTYRHWRRIRRIPAVNVRPIRPKAAISYLICGIQGLQKRPKAAKSGHGVPCEQGFNKLSQLCKVAPRLIPEFNGVFNMRDFLFESLTVVGRLAHFYEALSVDAQRLSPC